MNKKCEPVTESGCLDVTELRQVGVFDFPRDIIILQTFYFRFMDG